MRRAKVLFLLPLVGLFAGCIVAAAAAGAGGVFYIKGVAKKTYAHPVRQTFDASVSALKSAGVVITMQNADATSGKIEGVFADGDKMKMEFKALGEGTTEVQLRIGTFGDKDRSQFIYSEVDKRL